MNNIIDITPRLKQKPIPQPARDMQHVKQRVWWVMRLEGPQTALTIARKLREREHVIESLLRYLKWENMAYRTKLVNCSDGVKRYEYAAVLGGKSA